MSASALSDDGPLQPDAIVLLSTGGLSRRGRERLSTYVRGGGGILVAAGPDADNGIVSSVLADAGAIRIDQVDHVDDARVDHPRVSRTLAAPDIRHPVFQALRSDPASVSLARFERIVRVSGSGCQTIARFTTGEAALLDCSSGAGRRLLLASDLDRQWNDFPLHPTFVPFLYEAVKYLAGTRREQAEYFVGDAPAGVPREPGVRSGSRRFVVNLDPEESDPRRMSAASFQAAVMHVGDSGVSDVRHITRQQEERQHLWQYILGMMILVLVVESVVARQTA